MGRPFQDGGRGPSPGGPPARPGYGGADSYGSRGDAGSSSGGHGGGYGGGYGNQSGGYGGGQGGYASASGGGSRYGSSGYGGLGKPADDAGDASRDALFGDAKNRYQQKPPSAPQEDGATGEQPGGYGSEAPGGYGAYGDRQLTAEEAEEEDVQATKQQIRFMKQEDVSSTRNALRIAAQAEETGRGTLERLGAQGERIHNTEKNLDLAMNHNRIAEEKARELKTLNQSMFAVHVSNPFNKNSRKERRDQEILERHQDERDAREATRQAAYDSRARVDGAVKGLQANDQGPRPGKSSLAERSKYQFEADSEDDEMENEIDANLDALSGAASRLNHIARATGKEVDEQNKHIERIHAKVCSPSLLVSQKHASID
jgi:hypothetical protein